jgi:hypothetical protein
MPHQEVKSGVIIFERSSVVIQWLTRCVASQLLPNALFKKASAGLVARVAFAKEVGASNQQW